MGQPDYAALRKKFPVKDPKRKRKNAALKAIAREYELKRAELGRGAPVIRRGIVFYAVLVIGLMMLGALVLSANGRGGRARISRAALDVRKSVDALALALGRYRYHVGEYPSTAEGLQQLASTTVARKGWDGPYIKRVVKDPWGHDYVYARNAEGQAPTLYSKGPDGLAGTTDDVLPDPELFERPIKDTSWTQGWMPYRLRGYVVAPDEATRRLVEKQVEEVYRENATPKTVPPLDRTGEDWKAVLADMKAVATADGWRRYDESLDENGGQFTWIVSHWSWEGREGETVPVTCRTSGDEAELFVNGDSVGRIRAPFEWKARYEPGEIKVIAFRDGSPIGESVRKTAWKPFSVEFASDGTDAGTTLADGACAAYAVAVADEDGVWVATATNGVTVSVEGPGEIVETAAGPCGTRGPVTLALADGRAAFVVRRTGGSALPVRVRAEAKGLRPAEVAVPRK